MPADPLPLQPIDEESEPFPELNLDPESTVEAVYRLESWVHCPHCHEEIDSVGVVRLLRGRVNFISTLPRKGQVAVCPGCRTMLPVQLGGFV